MAAGLAAHSSAPARTSSKRLKGLPQHGHVTKSRSITLIVEDRPAAAAASPHGRLALLDGRRRRGGTARHCRTACADGMGAPLMTVLISRAEAREKGVRHYFTGRPCKHGHVVLRFAASGNCVVCLREWATQRYLADIEGQRIARRERRLRAIAAGRRPAKSSRAAITALCPAHNLSKGASDPIVFARRHGRLL
jgi:hypothetical protein